MRRFLLLIYIYGFCRDLVFLYPLHAIMFADRGLSTSAISLLFIAWSVTAMLLEVPSGAIADRYPRKHVLIFALLAKMAAYTVWMLFPYFWGFLAGFVCWGPHPPSPPARWRHSSSTSSNVWARKSTMSRWPGASSRVGLQRLS